MQQTQGNCLLAFAFLVLGTLLAPTLATAAAGPDPLLAEAQGPCNPGLEGPNYVAGTDVDGNPVAAADVPAPKMSAPDGILVPLGSSGRSRRSGPQAYAELNQKDVDRLINPKPACPRSAR